MCMCVCMLTFIKVRSIKYRGDNEGFSTHSEYWIFCRNILKTIDSYNMYLISQREKSYVYTSCSLLLSSIAYYTIPFTLMILELIDRLSICHIFRAFPVSMINFGFGWFGVFCFHSAGALQRFSFLFHRKRTKTPIKKQARARQSPDQIPT